MAKLRHQLPSQTWVNGGNIQIPTKSIPRNARVRAFVFRLEGLFTTGAAAAAIASTQLHRLIQMIEVDAQHRGSGAYWHFNEWMRHGREVNLPGGLPAANAEAHRRHVTWVVPYRDPRAFCPADAEIVGAQLPETISIDTAAFASLGAGTWDTLASIAGTLRCEAYLDEPNDAIGAPLVYGFADLTGQAPELPPGLYKDLWVYRENAATISSAQIATVTVQADGIARHDQTRLSEYTRSFNEILAAGSDLQTASATAPVPGEVLPETPAYTAGAADTVTAPFLPVLFPDRGFKLTQLLRAESNLRLDFTGTDTSFRVGFAKYNRRSEAEAVAAFRAIGRADVTSASQIVAKTASKKSLRGNKAHFAGYFPLRAVKSR